MKRLLRFAPVSAVIVVAGWCLLQSLEPSLQGMAAYAEGQSGQGGAVSGNGDTNGDGGIDLSDAIYLLTHLFQGGDPPEESCPPGAAGAAGGGGDEGDEGDEGDRIGGGGRVGLGLPDTGATLCWDTHTVPCPSQEPPEQNCLDNVDNDGDGRTDCADSDCNIYDPGTCPNERDTTGSGPAVDCTDGLDNDGDGDTDCDDSDCALLARVY